MIDWLFSVEVWISLATLTVLELVLGIDNLVVLAIAASKLPRDERKKAQRIGLLGALVLRISGLFFLVWLTKLTKPVMHIGDFAVSWRDIILFFGGLFLLWKATVEIHSEIEGNGEEEIAEGARGKSFMSVIMIIMVIDFIFALDSIITAVAMTQFLPVMIAANVIAIIMMIMAAQPISDFIEQHPTVKILALSFILLVGVALIADGLHFHIPREYIYFAIVFSLGVEFINMLVRRSQQADNNIAKGDE